jgi:hypothetical protein
MITRLFSMRRQNRTTDPCGRIAGEVFSYQEYQNFKFGWAKVFPDVLGRNAVENLPAGDNDTDVVAWAYLGLYRMATQAGIRVSDNNVVAFKSVVYQMHNGRDADLGDTAQVRRWLRERMGMTGERLDEILRERLMAESMMTHIVEGLEPMEAEAEEAFRRENRGVRVKHVTFSSMDFVGKAAEPTEDQVNAAYEAEKGFGGPYFSPPTMQIEYAQVSRAKAEAECRITADEMRKYYDENKDLYRVNEPKGQGPESEYRPFPEVKPEIEATLKSGEARAKATRVLEQLAKDTRGTPGSQLETLVKANKEGVLEYFRTTSLTEAELLTLPGIGRARAGGRGIVEVASELDPKEPGISPVISGTDGWYVLRPVAVRSEGNVPELSEVKAKVILDLKRAEALALAQKAAADFALEVAKSGGAGKFEESAARHTLVVKETFFFINTAVDVNRPSFIDASCALEMGEVYGPLLSVHDGVAGVVKVVAERPADPLGFAGERLLKRDSTWNAKLREFRRVLFPRTILTFAGYQDLRPPSEPEKPPIEPTDD